MLSAYFGVYLTHTIIYAMQKYETILAIKNKMWRN